MLTSKMRNDINGGCNRNFFVQHRDNIENLNYYKLRKPKHILKNEIKND